MNFVNKNSLLVGFIATITMVMTPSAIVAVDRQFQLSFSPDSISTVVSEAVVRGDRDEYHFNAQANQFISIAITSYENNAVFSVWYRENGRWQEIAYQQNTWSDYLPTSDNNSYMISVGGTRGNATYDLFVGIAPN